MNTRDISTILDASRPSSLSTQMRRKCSQMVKQRFYSFIYLILALRKSPQVSGAGFRQAATKLLTVVDLLLGDIPERSRFTEKVMEVALKPYFSLTQAVRIGNLSQFNKGEQFYE